MGAVLQFADRLMNLMTGKGTTVDRRAYAGYAMTPISVPEVEAAYRTSWMLRKLVDIPPLDMTRAWRDWQADAKTIEAIEKEERRLQLKAKCKRALILARLYGGGALVLGDGATDPEQPLQAERIGRGGLKYIHVLSRHQLSLGERQEDPAAGDWWLKPKYFEINAANGRRARLHPSRVVEFIGQPTPEGSTQQAQEWFWGDPIIQSIESAIKNADSAQDGFANLIDEAKLDILKLPELTNIVGTEDGTQKVMNRLQAAAAGKSMWRALILDKEDEWEHRQINWAGMPDIIMTYLAIVCGAADIPVTRFLSQSPKGLQSTGDGEERDYHAMVDAKRDEQLVPGLDRVDECLIRSALGKRPDEVYYEWAPLHDLSEKDAAEVESKYATTIKTIADTGLVSEEALGKAAINGMIERGRFPGLEQAVEEAGNEGLPEDDPDLLETQPKLLAAKAEQLRIAGAVSEDQATLLIADARPRTLYVQRKLINTAEFLKWAKGQGFTTTEPAEDLHVTVLYSRAEVDWLKMGAAWNEDDKGNLTVPAGGARIVEALGDKGAVVLLFNSSALSWRHEEMVRQGASHDFDEYQPHVTITYEKPDELDLEKVKPFTGKLVFGPEIFEEIEDDQRKGIGT